MIGTMIERMIESKKEGSINKLLADKKEQKREYSLLSVYFFAAAAAFLASSDALCLR